MNDVALPWRRRPARGGPGRGRAPGRPRAVVADRRSGRLRGATVVGRHAGDLIGEASLALRLRATLGDLSATIHPYPTLAEAFPSAYIAPA